MDKDQVYALPNVSTPSRPVIFNPAACNGCNRCVEVCPLDVYIPNPRQGQTPLILHPDECWYCGTCVNECPTAGAISFNWPLQQRGYWKSKASGQVFQV